MKYAYIQQQSATHAVERLCRILSVSSSGYYDWKGRPVSNKVRRDESLKIKVRISHAESHGIYGSPRIYQDLKAQGESVARKRVARLMQEEQIVARAVKVFKRTTIADPTLPVASNLLAQDFRATAPNQRWVSDITYIRTQQGWLYLAMIMDLYSRVIVGWAMDKHMTVELVADALVMAMSRRKTGAGLILHSDRGCQYAAKDYQLMLSERGIRCSMSGRGNCYDNAAAESFFHSLKTEWVHHYKYATRQEAKASLFEYIEMFYNRKRRHSYVNQMAPMQFEELMNAA